MWNGEQWSGWLEDLPLGLFLSGPVATARGADQLDVLALGEVSAYLSQLVARGRTGVVGVGAHPPRHVHVRTGRLRLGNA